MIELFRSNDPVKLSWAISLLEDAGIPALLFDRNASIVEGSIGAIQQRVMVSQDDFDRARRILREAAETPSAGGV